MAEAAIDVFQRITRNDDEDALADLLCDLTHWADKNGFDFEAPLNRARYVRLDGSYTGGNLRIVEGQ